MVTFWDLIRRSGNPPRGDPSERMSIRGVGRSEGPAQGGQRKALLHAGVFDYLSLIVVVHERVCRGPEVDGEGYGRKQNANR
jgi:hypothetical protein